MQHIKPIRRMVVPVLLVLTMVACTLSPAHPTAIPTPPGVTGTASNEQPAVEASPGAGLPTATPLPESETPSQPAPLSYTEALERAIQDGVYTREQALIAALKSLTGEGDDLPELSGEQIFPEGQEIVELAEEYIRQGTDPAARAELQRLVDRLLPSVELLLEKGKLALQEAGRSPGLASPLRQEVCSPEDVTCVLYQTYTLDGTPYHVFYPQFTLAGGTAWWESLLPIMESTLQQVHNEYKSYGSTVQVSIRFSNLRDVRLRNPLADPSARIYALAAAYRVPQTSPQDCPVVVFSDTAALPAAQFQQILAHELWHCFTSKNYPAQHNQAKPDSSWWVEATANYFSDRVYPAPNIEYFFNGLGRFDDLIPSQPLTSLSYAAFSFFEFLGQRSGPAAVMDLISRMPVIPGAKFQIEALNNIPRMQETFHAFARAYLDGQLTEMGGSVIPYNPRLPDVVTLNASQQKRFEVSPLTIRTYLLDYALEQGFANTLFMEGAPGNSAVQVPGTPLWGSLPSNVGKDCRPRTFRLLATTTNVLPHTLQLDTASNDEVGCADECLVGKWNLVPSSFFMPGAPRQQANHTSAIIPLSETASGAMTLEFTADRMTMNFLNLTLGFRDQVDGATIKTDNQNVLTYGIFNGVAAGEYRTEGAGLLRGVGSGSNAVKYSIWMKLNDQPPMQILPDTSLPAMGAGGGAVAYSCSRNVLLYDPFTPNGGPLQYLIFTRASP